MAGAHRSTTIEDRAGLSKTFLMLSRSAGSSRPNVKRGARLAGAVQVLEHAGAERRMAPHGLGGASGQRAGDVHPVRGLQEDDLGSQGAAVEPAAGGSHRDGFAVTVGVLGDGPGAGADGEGQRVGRLDEADLPAAGPWRRLDRGQEGLNLRPRGAGGSNNRGRR